MFSILKNLCFKEKKKDQINVDIKLPSVIDTSEGLKYYPVGLLLDKYKSLIDELKETSGLDYQTFQNYIFPLIENYGKYVHLLPASERHHHRYGGGLFVHGLEVAICAGKLSRNIIFDRDNTENRHEFDLKWRCGCIAAGLLHDLGKPVSDFVVRSDNGKFEWCPFVETLDSWLEVNKIEKYFVNYQLGRYRNHELLGLSALDLVLTREFRAFLSPNSSREILSAIYSYLGGHNLTTKFSQLIMEADQSSVKQDLKKSKLKGDDLLSCVPIERHIFEAIIKLIESGRWKINTIGGRVWVLETGIFINWRSSIDIINILLKDKVPAIPRDCEKLADVLFERGYADYLEKKVAGDIQKLRYHTIIPDIANTVPLQALKLSDGALIFPRLIPPSIPDLYSQVSHEGSQELLEDNSFSNDPVSDYTSQIENKINNSSQEIKKSDDHSLCKLDQTEYTLRPNFNHQDQKINIPKINATATNNIESFISVKKDDLLKTPIKLSKNKKQNDDYSTNGSDIKIIGKGGAILKNIILEFIEGKPIVGFLTNSRSVIINADELFSKEEKEETLRNLHKEKIVNAHEKNYYRLNATWSKYIFNKCEETNSKILRVPLNFMSTVRLNKNLSQFAPKVIPIKDKDDFQSSSVLAIDTFLPNENANDQFEGLSDLNSAVNSKSNSKISSEIYSSIMPMINTIDLSIQDISNGRNKDRTNITSHFNAYENLSCENNQIEDSLETLEKDTAEQTITITEKFFLDLKDQITKNNFSSISILENEKAISSEDFQNFVLNKYPSLDYLNLLACMGSNNILGANAFRYTKGQITCRE